MVRSTQQPPSPKTEASPTPAPTSGPAKGSLCEAELGGATWPAIVVDDKGTLNVFTAGGVRVVRP